MWVFLWEKISVCLCGWATERGMKSAKALQRGRRVWIQASTRLSKRELRKKGGEWKESGPQRRSPKTWIECMCLLTQLITLYRGHGLTLYTAHTRSSGKGWDVSSNCNSIWESEWISLAIPPNPVACVGWCYPNSSGKERLSLTPYSLIVHREALQSVTGLSTNSMSRLGVYTQTLLSYGPCVTTCARVYAA